MIVTKIGKREARKRYDAGLPIAMAAEPDWFDTDREGRTFTRTSLGWDCTFDEVHTERHGTRYSYAAPVEGS